MQHSKSLFLLPLLALSACSSLGTSSKGTTATFSDSGLTNTSVTTSSGSTKTVTDSVITYEQFWALGTKTTIELHFSNAALYALSDNGANYDLKYGGLRVRRLHPNPSVSR